MTCVKPLECSFLLKCGLTESGSCQILGNAFPPTCKHRQLLWTSFLDVWSALPWEAPNLLLVCQAEGHPVRKSNADSLTIQTSHKPLVWLTTELWINTFKSLLPKSFHDYSVQWLTKTALQNAQCSRAHKTETRKRLRNRTGPHSSCQRLQKSGIIKSLWANTLCITVVQKVTL